MVGHQLVPPIGLFTMVHGYQHGKHDAAANLVDPSVKRSALSEPVSTGDMVTNRPNWVALGSGVSLIEMPITASIIHTMKHTENESAGNQRRESLPFFSHSNHSFNECGDFKLRGLCTLSLSRTGQPIQWNYAGATMLVL